MGVFDKLNVEMLIENHTFGLKIPAAEMWS